MPRTKEEYAAYQRGWRRRWRLKNPEKAKQMNREKMRRWRSAHPEVAKRINKNWRTKNIEKALIQERNSRARSMYGLSSYAEACELRKRPCGICGSQRKRMHIDHHHSTSKTYRGVLCEPCNLRLGWFENRREAILKYLGE